MNYRRARDGTDVSFGGGGSTAVAIAAGAVFLAANLSMCAMVKKQLQDVDDALNKVIERANSVPEEKHEIESLDGW